ncbi:rRNA maturation RNase YbeY [[Mycoplasma] testudinis]|uniref:rRNA maturation RNase YbeY n=1 Tax=[Mycoplasma] testudinis TaxID=33924 RepID=UPI000697586F|nr:rRNA maturation RNase YbeY [[Mycoplasma] testudinis]
MLIQTSQTIPKQNKNNEIDFLRLFKIVNEQVSLAFEIKIDLFYEISFISEASSQKFNNKYRKKDYVADVISIPLWENQAFVTPLLGEIYMCLPKIKKQAKKYGVSYLSEIARMLIHGILHLLEFDHEQSVTLEYVTLKIQDKIHKKVLKQY